MLANALHADALDEIVVTATRLESSVRDVARSISVIDQQEIQNGQQLLGLDEVLLRVPGLYMQNRYNFAQDLKVSLRGFGSQANFGIRSLRIFVDDIPETLPDGQSGVDSIDLGSTSRIEVLRGPASSLYGNAAGGVVAIYSELGTDSPYAEASLSAGDHGYWRPQLKVAGSSDSLSYMVNASRTELDGYRDHSRARGTNINGKLSFELSGQDKLLLAFNNTDQPQAQDPGGIDATQLADDRRSARLQNVNFDAGEELEQQRLGAVYKARRSGGEWMLRNYYVWRDFTSRLPFTDGGAVDLQRSFYGIGAQYSTPQGGTGRLRLTAGLDLDRQDDERQRFDNNNGVVGDRVFEQDETVTSRGLYLQGQLQLSPLWSLSAGLRRDKLRFDVRDRHLQDGDDSGALPFAHWSPSLALSRSSGSSVLFASWSSAFETPTTTELANPDGSGGFNRMLRPQLADNVEIGFKSSGNTLFYELSVFRIELEQELVPFEIASSPGRSFYANAGSSSRDGVEAALSWDAGNGLSARVSYTWSDFRFDEFVEDGVDFGGNRLPGLPERFAYVSLGFTRSPGFSATLESQFSGKTFANNANSTPVPAYSLSNLRLGYEWQRSRWTVRSYLGINNIFDARYNGNIRINAFGGRYYEPAPERNIYASVVVRRRSASDSVQPLVD
jgi:iron complex outermembrane receptor protein